MTSGDRQIDYQQALLDPSSVFKAPGDIAASQDLSTQQKLALLRSWEEDAREMDRAADEGMGGGERSHLRDIELLIEQLEAQGG